MYLTLKILPLYTSSSLTLVFYEPSTSLQLPSLCRFNNISQAFLVSDTTTTIVWIPWGDLPRCCSCQMTLQRSLFRFLQFSERLIMTLSTLPSFTFLSICLMPLCLHVLICFPLVLGFGDLTGGHTGVWLHMSHSCWSLWESCCSSES